jgi:DNA-binding SARP family transcriptional activator
MHPVFRDRLAAPLPKRCWPTPVIVANHRTRSTWHVTVAQGQVIEPNLVDELGLDPARTLWIRGRDIESRNRETRHVVRDALRQRAPDVVVGRVNDIRWLRRRTSRVSAVRSLIVIDDRGAIDTEVERPFAAEVVQEVASLQGLSIDRDAAIRVATLAGGRGDRLVGLVKGAAALGPLGLELLLAAPSFTWAMEAMSRGLLSGLNASTRTGVAAAAMLGLLPAGLHGFGDASVTPAPWWDENDAGVKRVNPIWLPAIEVTCSRLGVDRRGIDDVSQQLVLLGHVDEACRLRVPMRRRSDDLVEADLDETSPVQPASTVSAVELAATETTVLEPGGSFADRSLRGAANTSPERASSNRGSLVEVRLLGTFQIVVDGQPLMTIRSGAGRSAFEVLALNHPRPVSRDRLLDTLWPYLATKAARNRLHVGLHALRHSVPVEIADRLVVYRDGLYRIGLGADLWFDVEEFRRRCAIAADPLGQLSAADAIRADEESVELYGGRLLGDLPFTDWCDAERTLLHESFLDASARLCRRLVDIGRVEEAIARGHEALRHDRCSEEVHRAMMRAFVALGRPHLAIRQFEACRKSLRDELDLDCSMLTVLLHEAVRARRPLPVG